MPLSDSDLVSKRLPTLSTKFIDARASGFGYIGVTDETEERGSDHRFTRCYWTELRTFLELMPQYCSEVQKSGLVCRHTTTCYSYFKEYLHNSPCFSVSFCQSYADNLSRPNSRDGFNLLGCPIGPPPFTEAAVMQRMNKLKVSMSRLADLEDSQMETALLRSYFAFPKVAYSLRTCPPGHICQAISSFDDTMREALSDLTGGSLSKWSWLKASLPTSRGGLTSVPWSSPAN